MNKENEEEMLSFDGDIYFERMFSPICFGCIGVTVVAISSDEKQLIDRLDQIADTQAKEYVSIEGSILMEEHTDTRYEISGGISGNARFYITEEPAVINEALMGDQQSNE